MDYGPPEQPEEQGEPRPIQKALYDVNVSDPFFGIGLGVEGLACNRMPFPPYPGFPLQVAALPNTRHHAPPFFAPLRTSSGANLELKSKPSKTEHIKDALRFENPLGLLAEERSSIYSVTIYNYIYFYIHSQTVPPRIPLKFCDVSGWFEPFSDKRYFVVVHGNGHQSFPMTQPLFFTICLFSQISNRLAHARRGVDNGDSRRAFFLARIRHRQRFLK